MLFNLFQTWYYVAHAGLELRIISRLKNPRSWDYGCALTRQVIYALGCPLTSKVGFGSKRSKGNPDIKLLKCARPRLNQATARLAMGQSEHCPASPRLQYLVGQFLVQLLSNGVVELPLKLPRGYAHRVHHLHQDEHPALGLWEPKSMTSMGAWDWGWGASLSRLRSLSASHKPDPQLGQAGGPALRLADAAFLPRRKLKPIPPALEERGPTPNPTHPATCAPPAPRAEATHHSHASHGSQVPELGKPNHSASGNPTNKKPLPAQLRGGARRWAESATTSGGRGAGQSAERAGPH